jgi:hypothetical protein
VAGVELKIITQITLRQVLEVGNSNRHQKEKIKNTKSSKTCNIAKGNTKNSSKSKNTNNNTNNTTHSKPQKQQQKKEEKRKNNQKR